MVVDTRDPAGFGGAHIIGSYSIWLGGLSDFAGSVLPVDNPILLVMERPHDLEKASRQLETRTRKCHGYLKGGIEPWYEAGLDFESLSMISVHRLKNLLDKGASLFLLDTRREEEWRQGHIQVQSIFMLSTF